MFGAPSLTNPADNMVTERNPYVNDVTEHRHLNMEQRTYVKDGNIGRENIRKTTHINQICDVDKSPYEGKNIHDQNKVDQVSLVMNPNPEGHNEHDKEQENAENTNCL